ncbi:hypothetical protein LTR95_014267 [Oleoguttula sp. CCFEE 5521]
MATYSAYATISASDDASSNAKADMSEQSAVFRFTELGAELRDIVYGFYFEDIEPDGTTIALSTLETKRPSFNLVLASHRTCAEALSFWNRRFWQSHRFCLGHDVLPGPEIIDGECVVSRPGLKKTVIGDIDRESFQISNVTPLGDLIKPLKRLYIGLSSRPAATIVIWEAVNRNRTQDADDWKRAAGQHSRTHGFTYGDYRWARRTHTSVVVSRMTMIEELTAYLQFLERDRDMIYCFGGGRREEPDWSEDGDIFMIEESRG